MFIISINDCIILNFNWIKFKYPDSGTNKTLLTRKTNNDWAKALSSQIKYDTSIYSFDTSKFYKEVLDYILLGKDDKIKIKNKNLLSKNIKSFKISANSYPNFKMRVLLDYGTYGGNNIEAENFEMDWVVCPVN